MHNQNIALQLGEMWMGLETARTALYRAAWSVDYAEEYDVKFAFLTKTLCTETAFRIATMAMEILGGYGYMKDMHVEKYMRDIISTLHGAGSGNIFRMKCAALL